MERDIKKKTNRLLRSEYVQGLCFIYYYRALHLEWQDFDGNCFTFYHPSRDMCNYHSERKSEAKRVTLSDNQSLTITGSQKLELARVLVMCETKRCNHLRSKYISGLCRAAVWCTHAFMGWVCDSAIILGGDKAWEGYCAVGDTTRACHWQNDAVTTPTSCCRYLFWCCRLVYPTIWSQANPVVSWHDQHVRIST
jgi:hypothetical protein